MNVTVKQVFYWGISALTMIALAGPMPDVATGLVLLLIVSVALIHWQDFQVYFPKKESK